MLPRRVATKRLVAMEGETVTYIVDPKEKKNKSEKSETIGWREIISVILVTPDISGLFLMVFYKADYFGGFGHLKILDRWRNARERILSHEDWMKSLSFLLRSSSPAIVFFSW